MAICTVIPAYTEEEAVDLAASSPTRCVEVRADFMNSVDEALKAVEALSSTGFRVVATLRLRSEGGLATATPAEAARFASRSLDKGAWMADVVVDTIKAVGGAPAGSGILASIHTTTPPQAVEVLRHLEVPGVDAVKVASGYRGLGDIASIVGLNPLAPGRVAAFPIGIEPPAVAARILAAAMGAPVVYGVHDRVDSRLPGVPRASILAGIASLMGLR